MSLLVLFRGRQAASGMKLLLLLCDPVSIRQKKQKRRERSFERRKKKSCRLEMQNYNRSILGFLSVRVHECGRQVVHICPCVCVH